MYSLLMGEIIYLYEKRSIVNMLLYYFKILQFEVEEKE